MLLELSTLDPNRVHSKKKGELLRSWKYLIITNFTKMVQSKTRKVNFWVIKKIILNLMDRKYQKKSYSHHTKILSGLSKTGVNSPHSFIQAVLVKKGSLNRESATKLVHSHGFNPIKMHETINYYRFRLVEPKSSYSYRTKILPDEPYNLVIAFRDK